VPAAALIGAVIREIDALVRVGRLAATDAEPVTSLLRRVQASAAR
jgi:hypothetical protein